MNVTIYKPNKVNDFWKYKYVFRMIIICNLATRKNNTMDNKTANYKLTVVIPVYNEEGNMLRLEQVLMIFTGNGGE